MGKMGGLGWSVVGIKVWREMHYNARDNPFRICNTCIVVKRIEIQIKGLDDVHTLAVYYHMQEFDGTSDNWNRVILYA